MEGKMKAAVLYGIKDIRCEMVDIPTVEDNEVLVKVKYAGICGSDLPRSMISGVSGGKGYPIILGHEFCGEVVEVGEKAKDFSKGDRVAIAPLVPCGECEFCKAGNFGLCPNYNIIGTRSDGAFAEYVKVPKEHILKLPESLDYETASGIEPATIGYHGIAKANLEVGNSVVVLGCGPIGQFTIQWAKIFGASKVIAVDIFPEKLELAKTLGADFVVNSKECDAIEKIKELTNGGADVVLETAGSKITQEQALLIARSLGTVVFLGISHSDLPLTEKAAESILRKELTIKGSWNSYNSPYPGRAWNATISFMAKGKLVFKPMVSHKIKVEELGDYLNNMASRKIYFNKVLVEF